MCMPRRENIQQGLVLQSVGGAMTLQVTKPSSFILDEEPHTLRFLCARNCTFDTVPHQNPEGINLFRDGIHSLVPDRCDQHTTLGSNTGFNDVVNRRALAGTCEERSHAANMVAVNESLSWAQPDKIFGGWHLGYR